MLIIIVLGCVGQGLMWGWLIGSFKRQIGQLWQTHFALIIATLLLAIEVILFANWYMLFPFLSATSLSLLLHLLWRRQLHHRFDRLDHIR